MLLFLLAAGWIAEVYLSAVKMDTVHAIEDARKEAIGDYDGKTVEVYTLKNQAGATKKRPRTFRCPAGPAPPRTSFEVKV